MSRPCFAIAAAVAGFGVCGCAQSDPGFEAFFEEVGRIQLEETAADPIVGITHITRRPDGGFVLADRGAARVRLFDRAGRQTEVLGRRGEGPGEFRTPAAAVELPGGRIVVADGADPTLTIFDGARNVQLGRVPGQYGFWLERIAGNLVAGMGSRHNRFAILDPGGDTVATFGAAPVAVNEMPFWIFFARDRATVAGNRIAINTSFYPTMRVFDVHGDSLATIGGPPPFWIPAGPPPIDHLNGPGDRDRIAEWSRGFTVVRDLETVADTLLVVQYGSYDPQNGEPYYVRPTAIDVYALDGRKLAEALPLTQPIMGGGRELMVLSAQPPEPWTITTYRWQGH